ncbi:MAG: hypothetical protein QXP97_00050 [Desulfurococcus sp.]|uniref:hypothetical protein n=1 Tax=Desulfurococcus sp. TaxID=51678 RepID=UPI003165CE8B
MSSLVIELLDERTIGRNFQVAALGFIRSSLPPSIVNEIKKGLINGKIMLGANDLRELLNILAQQTKDVCESKKNLPKLYGKEDTKALSSIGIAISSAKSKEESKAKSKELCDALVNSVEAVLSNPTSETRIPQFLRTYVFGKYRTELTQVETSNAVSIYIATAGAIISMVDRLKAGETFLEQYLVPDGSIASFNEAVKVYGLIYASKEHTLDKFIESIYYNLENISLEVSLILATMAFTHYIATQVKGLQTLDQYYDSFETHRLVSIRPEMRPQVAWERPLTISGHLRALEKRNAIKMLDDLRSLASYAKSVGNEVEAYDDTISMCLHEIYGYMETGSLDLLTSCAGRITRILDTLNSKNICGRNKYVCTDLKSLLNHLMRLAY